VFAKAAPQFANGELYGCIVEFATVTQDWAYRQGAFIRVGGSFGLMSMQGKVGATLKVIVHDIDTSLTLTPSAPTNAHFVAKTKTSQQSRVASYPSDTPGAIFVVFQLDPAFSMIVDGLGANQVQIAFNRRQGGADVPVAIDTSVEDTLPDGTKKRSLVASSDFYRCVKELVPSGNTKSRSG
jgi:hypothetical protein